MPFSTQVSLGPGHTVLDADPAPSQNGLSSPQFSAHVLWPNGWIGWIKMKLRTEVGLGPGHIVFDGDPAPSPQKAQPTNFRPMSVVAKRLDGSRCHLVWRPRPSSPSPKRVQPPFSAHVCCGKWLDGLRCQLVGGRHQHCVR